MSALSPSRFTGRYHPYVLAPPSIYHHQKTPKDVHADCHKSLLMRIIVFYCQSGIIRKDGDGIRKGNSVFQKIRLRFLLIPLIVHQYTICTIVHRVKKNR